MFFVIFVILSPDEGDRFRSRIYHAFHLAIKFDFSREGFHLIKWCWNVKRDSILLCPLWIFVSYIAEVHTQFEHFRSRSTLYGTQDGNDAKVNLGWWIDIRIVDNEKNISKMFEFEFTWRGQRYEGIWKQRTARLKFMKTLEIIIDEDGWRLNMEALDNLIEWTSWRFDVLKGSDVAESDAVRSRSVFLHFPVRVHLIASARSKFNF